MQSTNTQSRNALKSVRRIREAGMTLVEIMIVIVIMALIGTGVTVALLPNLERASISATEDGVEVVRNAMTMYRLDNPRDCPHGRPAGWRVHQFDHQYDGRLGHGLRAELRRPKPVRDECWP